MQNRNGRWHTGICAKSGVAVLVLTVPFALTRLSLAQLTSEAQIFVDAAAAPNGDGSSPATAYRTIREAVNDANQSVETRLTIEVAQGLYIEEPNITITKNGVSLRGSTQHVVDARGLPTGEVVTAAVVKPSVGSAPAGTALLRVHASDVEISGLVFDGGFPRPTPGPGAQGLPLLRADGAPSLGPLAGLRIHGNSFQNTTQALTFRLASAHISRNFIGRNATGMVYFAGFDRGTDSEGIEQYALFEGNRVVDNVNYGTNFLGFVGSLNAPAFASFGLGAGPGINHVAVMNNDFARNGDARTPINGSYYPQAIQYSGLLFNTHSNDASDPLQPARIEATVGFNTFGQNGYGVGVYQRVALASPQHPSSFEAVLIGNKYCGNAFNSWIADFGLISQSHGATGGGQSFRYAQGSSYDIDARRDPLGEDDLDLDHPVTDPRLPAAGILGNTLLFNGWPIANGVRIRRPPVVSPGPPPVYAAPVTVPDTTAPQITRSLATPSTLWPPNGQMESVGLDVAAEDDCDRAPVCRIVSVSSDEPSRLGPAWNITAPLALQLRAERLGISGQDRVYTVTVRCTDAAGNSSMTDVAIRVPHDSSR